MKPSRCTSRPTDGKMRSSEALAVLHTVTWAGFVTWYFAMTHDYLMPEEGGAAQMQ